MFSPTATIVIVGFVALVVVTTIVVAIILINSSIISQEQGEDEVSESNARWRKS